MDSLATRTGSFNGIGLFDDERQQRLFRLFKRCKPNTKRWFCVRNALLETLLPMAKRVSRYYGWYKKWQFADDFHQIAALAIMRGIETFHEGRGVALNPYLWAKATKDVWRALERERRRPTENVGNDRNEASIESFAVYIDNEFRHVDAADSASAALGVLPAMQRAIVVGKYAHRLAFADLGEQLGVSLHVIKEQHKAAMQTLRDHYGAPSTVRRGGTLRRYQWTVAPNSVRVRKGGRFQPIRLEWFCPHVQRIRSKALATRDLGEAERLRIAKEAELRAEVY